MSMPGHLDTCNFSHAGLIFLSLASPALQSLQLKREWSDFRVTCFVALRTAQTWKLPTQLGQPLRSFPNQCQCGCGVGELGSSQFHK